MVSHFTEPAHGRWSRSAFKPVQRRRAGELRRIFAGHHAVHQRIDHDAVADRGDSAAWETCTRRWRAAKDYAANALRHSRAVHFPRLFAGVVISAPGIVSHDAARDYRHDQKPR